ncbi:MAG: branched-chain amino acid ABC transporter permease [Alphaproteobacteria bacterium]|nr:branched-chain amino acid ABC transporter permease [Alphaproteobacteria bacterium]
MDGPSPAAAFLLARHRWHWAEALPWLIAAAAFFLFPGWLALGTQILIMVLFALSLDLVLGYAGIVTLGHAAFFGTGAYAAGMLSVHLGWNEPISGLVFAAFCAAVVGLVAGLILLRTRGLTLLMLTLATTILLQEFANTYDGITGGFDGLHGIAPSALLGLFEFDLWFKVPYLYSLLVLLLMFLVARQIVYSPFGRELEGIRENVARMHAIGAPVRQRLVTIYTISAAMAGVAGGLFAQANAFVTLDVLSFQRSGAVLIVLILGGSGRLYGAFVGAVVYMLMEDQLAKLSPEFWEFGIGLLLVLTVLFARRGLFGLVEDLARQAARKRP